MRLVKCVARDQMRVDIVIGTLIVAAHARARERRRTVTVDDRRRRKPQSSVSVMSTPELKFETLQVHAGQAPVRRRPRAVPITRRARTRSTLSKHGADLFGLRAFGNIYSPS